MLRIASWFFVGLFLLVSPLAAAEKTLTLSGSRVVLQEASAAAVEVHFTSMRFNRSLNEWNVEVTLTNTGGGALVGPIVLYVDSTTNTAGILRADGTDAEAGGKAYYDLTPWIGDTLAPGQQSRPRTLSLSPGAGSPSLGIRLFAGTSSPQLALTMARVTDDAGQFLGGVEVVESGPVGIKTVQSDATFGSVSLGQGTGIHTWQFSRGGYLPVWRRSELTTNGLRALPSPRLVRRSTNSTVFTPINGGSLSDSKSGITIDFPPAAFSQNSTSVLTLLSGQTLPGLLPLGWSPLQAFWLELGSTAEGEGTVRLRPWAAITSAETAILARWDAARFGWVALQTLPGNGTNLLAFPINLPGAYALVVPDSAPSSPSTATVGSLLQAGPLTVGDLSSLSAGGRLAPSTAPASVNPEMVTAVADLVVTNAAEPLPSGLILQTELEERYNLRNGDSRVLPLQEATIIAYQRPGDTDPKTTHSRFLIRPSILLNPEELNIALLRVDVLTPTEVQRTIISTNGGQTARDGLRLIVGANAVDRPQLIQLRSVELTNFTQLLSNGLSLVKVFDLSTPTLRESNAFALQIEGATPDTSFLVARLLRHGNLFGLEPIQRLRSDQNGVMQSIEPANDPRLPGIVGAGQYLLLRLNAPVGVVQGVARNSAGEPAAGLLARMQGEPWMTFSGTGGVYRLVSTISAFTASVTDLPTGDVGFGSGVVANAATGALLNLGAAPAGPRVVHVTPATNAVRVPRIASVTLHFSEPLNAGSVVRAVQLLGTNNQPVPASVSLNLKNTIATLLPSAPLAGDSLHRIQLAATITDLNGQAIEGAREFTFTTETALLDRLGARVISHEPTNGLAAIVGSPGTAEPERAVILVNESTGETATVLSRVDGSFSNSIPATVDDFLSAVIVNQNGTRNTIPVSRQLFRDGSVGLFNGGGILEAQSDGAPVQIIVEPGAIPAKTVFKVGVVPLAQVLTELRGVTPTNGQVLGGFRFAADGDELKQPADVSFPIDVATLNLEPGESPTNRAFVLCRAIEVDGQTLFEILDKMEFEDGKLVTRSPPFPGLPATSFLYMPLMMSFGTSVTVGGQVVAVSEAAGHISEDEIRAGVTSDGTYPIRRLEGAVVSASPGILGPIALRSGAFVARANTRGFYAMMVPYNQFNPDGIFMKAQHIRFPGQNVYKALVPGGNSQSASIGEIVNLVFRTPASSGFDDTSAPTITPVPPAAVLPLNTNVDVQFFVRDDLSTPTLTSVTFAPEGSVHVLTGEPIQASSVVVSLNPSVTAGPNSIRVPVTFNVNTSAVVMATAIAQDGSGNSRTNTVRFRFGAPLPATAGNLPAGDPDDDRGPSVVSTMPVDGTVQSVPQVLFRFDEPVRHEITNDLAISINPSLEYKIRLSPSQREAVVDLRGMQPNTAYSITLSSAYVFDLSNNPISNSVTLSFRSPAAPSAALSGINNGAASVVLGAYAFTIDRGSTDGALVIHCTGDTGQVTPVGNLHLPFYPRTMVVIPEYAFKPSTNLTSKTVTNTLVVVAGGTLGNDGIGQFMWVIDVTDPAKPTRLSSGQVTVDSASAVTALKWRPPYVSTLFATPEGGVIQNANLQAFILGGKGEAGVAYQRGTDLNGDGDYVDSGEKIPIPERATFFGVESTLTVADKRIIDDFDINSGSLFSAVVMPARGDKPSRFQLLTYQGQFVGDGSNGDGAVEYPAQTPPVSARRVLLDLNLPVMGPLGVRFMSAAIVAVNNEVHVYDLSNPLAPALTNVVKLDPTAGNIFTLNRSDDDEYLVGTRDGIFALKRSQLGNVDGKPVSPAVQETFADAAVSGRGTGASDLEIIAAGSGAPVMINRSPRIRVVQIPTKAVISAQNLLSAGETTVREYLAAVIESQMLLPASLINCPTNIASPLGDAGSPPNPALHHYALIRANGRSGAVIDISAESLDLSGRLHAPKGKDYPPVFLTDNASSLGYDEMQETVKPLRAVRLSSNPYSDLYNTYLTDSFLVLRQALSLAQRQQIASDEFKRSTIWSGHFLRFAFDSTANGDPALQPWVSEIKDKKFIPNVNRTYRAFPTEYIDSPNPSYAQAAVRNSGVDLQSGEFRHPQMDLFVEGREQDLVMTRVYESRSRYMGPFGRGWDFNLNARLVELPEEYLPTGFELALRETGTNCYVAIPGDILFIDGAGAVHRFHKISPANGNDGQKSLYSSDPAIAEFHGLNSLGDFETFYESPEGVFSVLYKMRDGTYWMIGPTGVRMFFDAEGRITKMHGRSKESKVIFNYRADGRLDTVTGDRDIKFEFGYYYYPPSSFNTLADVSTTTSRDVGKIAKIRAQPSLANTSEVSYEYDADGNLFKVKVKDGPETIQHYDPADLNEMVDVGRGDGTQLPGLKLDYSNGFVTSITQDSETKTYAGAVGTSKDRYDAGASTVSITKAGNTVSFDIDERGRPTKAANLDFKADDGGRPVEVADDDNKVKLTYDVNNPVYRFRKNLLKTERGDTGSPKFITETDYDNSAWNRVKKSTDVNGVTTDFEYTASNMKEKVGGSTIVRTMFFNGYGQFTQKDLDEVSLLTSQNRMSIANLTPDGGLQVGENAFGMSEATTTRDARGRVKTISKSGRSFTMTYNVDGQPERMEGVNVPLTLHTYKDGMVETETVTMGSQFTKNTYTYGDPKFKTHASKVVMEETGLPNSTTTFDYNAQGQLGSYTVDGEQTILGYDGLRNTTLRGPGRDRTVEFNADGKTETLTEQGIEVSFKYDSAARVESTEQQGAKTIFTYDDGATLRTRLKQKRIEDPSTLEIALREDFEYDQAGRVKKVTSLGGRIKEYNFFADNAVRQVRLNGTLVRDVIRDQGGRITQSIVNDIQHNFSGFDPVFGLAGTEILTLKGSGFSLTRQNGYDAQGRLNSITLPVGTFNFGYDGFGHLNRREDPDHVSQQQTFAPSGKVLTTRFSDGTSATYGYNTQRRLRTILGANGIMTYGYDAEGLVNSIIYPDGAVSTFTDRNSFFQPDTITHGGVEQKLTWTDGRIEQIEVLSKGNTLAYEYDVLGRRTSADLDGAAVEFGYNAHGELSSESTDAGTWSIDLDSSNVLRSETYPSGINLLYAPNSYGHPTSVAQIGISGVTWHAGGLIDEVSFATGLKIKRVYDASLRNTGIHYKTNSSVAAGFEYSLSAGGRIQNEHRLHNDLYDVYLRTNAQFGSRIVGFLFNATNSSGQGADAVLGVNFINGELTASAQSPVGGDVRGFFPAITTVGPRVVAADGETVSYDARGSVLGVPLWVRLPGQTALTRVPATLDYDGLGMVRAVSRNDGVTVTYKRDGVGRIIERSVNGPADRCITVEQQLVWKGPKLIEEREKVGEEFLLVRRYFYLGNYLVLVQVATTPGGALVDHVPIVSLNGSVSGYLDLNGRLEETIDYSAYGIPSFKNNNDARSSSAVAGTLLFHGALFDPETGLYQMGERNLHPVLCRFLQRDSKLFAESLALFAAFNGDPAGRIDPFGTESSMAEASAALEQLKEAKEKASDLGEATGGLIEAINDVRMEKEDRELTAIGTATAEFLSKLTDAAAVGGDEQVQARAKVYTEFLDVAKESLGIAQAIGNIMGEYETLAAVKGASWAKIAHNIPRFGWLDENGASAGLPSLKDIDTRFGTDVRRVMITEAEFDAREAYGNLQSKTEEFYDNRQENLLNIGKGVHALAKIVFDKTMKDDDRHSVRIAGGVLETTGKLFDVIEAYKEAKGADDLAMMFLGRHNLTDIALSKAGRGAVSAAFDLGFEAGKLIAMAVSDPDTAKAYQAAVKQFEEDGGWFTVAGGILATVGLDDAAWAIQTLHDTSASDLIAPIIEERQRQQRRTEYYLNGISAP